MYETNQTNYNYHLFTHIAQSYKNIGQERKLDKTLTTRQMVLRNRQIMIYDYESSMWQ